jgi:hypothetical protein
VKNFSDEKADRPRTLSGAMLFIRGFAAPTTARSTGTNQSHPAPAVAMYYGVAGGCRYIFKTVACLNPI